MIAARPNQIPQYDQANRPVQAEVIKFKLSHGRYQNRLPGPKITSLPANPMAMLGQRSRLDQSLPSMKTPFELRHSLSKLGGIAGFYGSTTQNGKPHFAQTGLGKENIFSNKGLANKNH
jgi:hypothetical protein